MVDRKYKARHKRTARARTTARQPSVDPQAGLTRDKLKVLLSNPSNRTQAKNYCELEFKECIHELGNKKECKSKKKKCIKNLYNKLKITPRGSSRGTSRSTSRGSLRGSFLRPSKRSTKGGGKKLFSLDRLESRNKKFFNESLPKRKRTLKQKALDLQKKNKEHARQVKEERKYLKGSKKKRRRKKGQK